MKTIISPKVTVAADGKSCTIVCDIVDRQFSQFLMQRQTIGHLNPANIRFPRHVQISDQAVFVKGAGFGFAIPVDDVVAIAAAVEPRTTFKPLFKKQPQNASLTVEISSELNPDLQWEMSDGLQAGSVWTPISGATSVSLDKTNLPKGIFVRCVAKSEAGSMTSNPAQI